MVSVDECASDRINPQFPMLLFLLTDSLAGTACFLGLLRRQGLVGKDWHKEYSEGPNRIVGLIILDNGTGRG